MYRFLISIVVAGSLLISVPANAQLTAGVDYWRVSSRASVGTLNLSDLPTVDQPGTTWGFVATGYSQGQRLRYTFRRPPGLVASGKLADRVRLGGVSFGPDSDNSSDPVEFNLACREHRLEWFFPALNYTGLRVYPLVAGIFNGWSLDVRTLGTDPKKARAVSLSGNTSDLALGGECSVYSDNLVTVVRGYYGLSSSDVYFLDLGFRFQPVGGVGLITAGYRLTSDRWTGAGPDITVRFQGPYIEAQLLF